MSYRLWYFPARGRGEQIRLMLHALAQPFEEVPVTRERFVEMKKQGPQLLSFGAVPMLEDGEFRLVQGPVILGYLARKHGIAPTDLQAAARADSIALGAEDLRTKFFGLIFGDGSAGQASFLLNDWKGRWLSAFEGLLQLNGDTGYFVGSSLTHADVAVWDALDGVLTKIKGATLEGFPRLAAFRDRIAGLAGISSYLARRS